MSELMHPIDSRYRVDDLVPFLSEDAILKRILRIELAHVNVMERRGICPLGTYAKISERASQITAEMWSQKQKDPKYKHSIRALMALINEPLPDDMKRFFHLALTSQDSIDNANILALRDATYAIVIPDMVSLGYTLLDKAHKYRDTVQVGRTHGQHGEPTTFGREMAWHADRWGKALVRVKTATDTIEGKIGGAMGTKASLMLLGDAYLFEEEILKSVGLTPARITTQIAQPEDMANYYSQVLIAFGVINNLSNDMRQLARTEIGEYALELPEGHGKSSTMPHKGLSEQGVVIGNPEDFENVRGQYWAVMPHIISVYLSQESEHNRDLSNSSTERYYKPEILDSFVYSVRRCNTAMGQVRANEDVMKNRVENSWNLLMEPAFIALALDGVPNGQQYVRDALKTYGDFRTALRQDEKLRNAIEGLPAEQKSVFESPLNYIGASKKQVDSVVSYWSPKFEAISKDLKIWGV
jgi:adenylosuccinate lyase